MKNQKAEIEFQNWQRDLAARLFEFQVRPVNYQNKIDYITHKNAVNLDHEVHRLRKFGNPCRAPGCGLPLYLTNNFEIFGLGPVCHVCYDMHSVMAANRYFHDLHHKWLESRKNNNRLEPGGDYLA